MKSQNKFYLERNRCAYFPIAELRDDHARTVINAYTLCKRPRPGAALKIDIYKQFCILYELAYKHIFPHQNFVCQIQYCITLSHPL